MLAVFFGAEHRKLSSISLFYNSPNSELFFYLVVTHAIFLLMISLRILPVDLLGDGFGVPFTDEVFTSSPDVSGAFSQSDMICSELFSSLLNPNVLFTCSVFLNRLLSLFFFFYFQINLVNFSDVSSTLYRKKDYSDYGVCITHIIALSVL